MPIYEDLSPEKRQIISARKKKLSQFAFLDEKVIRRDMNRDIADDVRTPFIRDIDKIMNSPFYNRYSDKTQVFSLYKNDDITRRALHVQLVSRIARTIGSALDLNMELIEAIALGHDIGHTPFGHGGERILDELYCGKTGRHFSHNVHSVRVLDGIFEYNISLQTLDGIICHDGEMELGEYFPGELSSFEQFDAKKEECYRDKENVKKLIPSTMEGCVVRISDIISYIGKDRQDALRAHISSDDSFSGSAIGKMNAEMIRNLMINIIENSLEKPYIKLDETHFEALRQVKKENYSLIYREEKTVQQIDQSIRPMMEEIYEKLLTDLVLENKDSPIFRHHIDFVNKSFYSRREDYEQTEKNQIVVDYIASMTDDYFIDLYRYLFPSGKYDVKYYGYFDS